MGKCFRTSGRECKCEDISIKSFANRCSIVAPLALKCDGGDESACEAMDDATEGMEDLLPDYLQDVMMDIERRYGEDQFDLHMPEECQEAGAKTPKECMKVMFRLNAPEECIKALDEGKIDLSNEREARKACDEIMFRENAPEECIEAGLKDPKECGKLMFRENAPEECIEAGLTGDNRGDEKKCREIMESQGKGPGGQGQPALGVRCRNIENSEERLKCYDSALEGSRSEERNQGGWPSQCEEAKAFTRESCENVMREFGERQRQEFQERREEFRPSQERGEVPQECEGLSPEECSRRFEERREEFRPPEGGLTGEQPQQPIEGETTQPPTTQEGIQTSPESSQTTTEPQTSGETQTDSSGSSGTSGTTGSVVFGDNEFFNYYYR